MIKFYKEINFKIRFESILKRRKRVRIVRSKKKLESGIKMKSLS